MILCICNGWQYSRRLITRAALTASAVGTRYDRRVHLSMLLVEY